MHCHHLHKDFHVVTMISNPVRYSSRYELFKKFEKHMRQSGVHHLHVVEVQNGRRAFQVTNKNNPYHIQLRTNDEIWIKENALNLAINRLTPKHPNWKYIAWIDADIEFTRKDWVEETIEELQVSSWVQMFQTAIDLGPDGQAIATYNGFMYSYWNDKPQNNNYASWHPGYAWAATRESLTKVGLLIDGAILGAADRHMAMALIGKGKDSIHSALHPDYQDMVMSWEKRAEDHVRRRVGYVKGNIIHGWHGKKRDRGYHDRWQILIKNKYSPYRHVYKDWQGVYQFDLDAITLRDDVKKYFRSRNEDSIDLI